MAGTGMSIQFRPAIREKINVMIGLAGPSKSGKTFSSLRLASAIAKPDKIFFIDTETGRAKQYADTFGFMHAQIDPPFSYDRYTEALKDAASAGAEIIIVDSMSHAHEGEGGLVDQAEAELQRMAGSDFAKRERVKFAAWIKPKARYNRFVQTMLQFDRHFIFCFRAKEKLAMIKNAKGKTEIVNTGWQPICTQGLHSEVDAMLILPAGAKGVPDLGANASDFRGGFEAIFKDGKQLDETCGAALAEWARGGAAPVAESAGASTEPGPPPAATKTPLFERDTYALSPVAGSGNENWPQWDKLMRKAADAAPDAAAIDKLVADNSGHMSSYHERRPDTAGALAQYIEDVRRIVESAGEPGPPAAEGAAP